MKRHTIRNHRDFITPQDGLKVALPSLVLRVKPVKIKNDPRYGIIASKKVFKLAVHRNRAKRLLRDWIAFNEDFMMPEFDYVFIAKARVLETNREDGRRETKKAFDKIIQLSQTNAE